MTRRLPLFLLTALLIAAPASADDLQLADGSRLAGTVVSLAGGTLTFDTGYGPLRIPWTEVAALTVTDPIRITVGAAAPVEVRLAAGAAPGQLVLDPGGPVPLADVVAMARPAPAVVIDGGANAGFITTTGNTDVNSLRLDGDLLATAGQHRYTASAAVNRAKDGDVETSRNWTSTFKYDRFIHDGLFLNANAIFTSDRFRDLDLRSAFGVGLGYQVLTTPVVTLTVDAGFGYVDENLEAQPDDSYSALRESASLGLALVPGRVQLFHQHDGYFGVTGDDNLFVKMQNGVRVGLAGGLVTTLRHDFDYDRTPAAGRQTTDRTFALTLGYRF